MKEIYMKGILKKVSQELELDKFPGVNLKVGKTGAKITMDGVEYFDKIEVVDIYHNFTKIGEYDLSTKTLNSLRRVGNIVSAQVLVNLVNNFVGYEKFKINSKKLADFYTFFETLDEGVSEYEAGIMFKFSNM